MNPPLLIVQAPDLSQAIELAQALVDTCGLVISVAADAPERVTIDLLPNDDSGV